MKRPDLSFYLSMVNAIVTDTEKIGAELNPYFEEVNQVIQEGTSSEFDPIRLQEIVKEFEEGTKKYRRMLEKIHQLRPTARLLGMHKKFERAYLSYVAGCEEMVASLSESIDIPAFRSAELKQDEATDEIAMAIQKMTQSIMK